MESIYGACFWNVCHEYKRADVIAFQLQRRRPEPGVATVAEAGGAQDD